MDGENDGEDKETPSAESDSCQATTLKSVRTNERESMMIKTKEVTYWIRQPASFLNVTC